MPSRRRIKVFSLLLILAVVVILFFTSSSRTSDASTGADFYDRTVSALNNKQKPGTGTGSSVAAGAGGSDEEVAAAMAQSLKDAAKIAKDNANAKAPKPDAPSEVVGVGSAAGGVEKGVAGRKKFSTGSGRGGDDDQVVLKEEKETEEDHMVEVELNSILKRSPIIIFSKSYCPHSKRAKNILLEKYIIDPAPHVVELDQHEIGSQLQARLAELTGRRTVPNVLINGVSIGGGDDVAELDAKKALVSKVKDLGGKRMLDVRERPPADDQADAKEEEKEKAEVKREPHGL